MQVKAFVEGPVEANNYLVIDEASKEAVLIDCSAYSRDILDAAEEAGVKVKYILLTHGHFDHVLGVNGMKKALGARALIHGDDAEWLKHINETLAMFGGNETEIPEAEELTPEELSVGSTKIEVLHTPGHTGGGVCYLIDGNLFSGDTLFYETVGRTDLPSGNFRTLKNSVENLFALDDSTVVYPGHGRSTTIGHEKKYNEVL